MVSWATACWSQGFFEEPTYERLYEDVFRTCDGYIVVSEGGPFGAFGGVGPLTAYFTSDVEAFNVTLLATRNRLEAGIRRLKERLRQADQARG